MAKAIHRAAHGSSTTDTALIPPTTQWKTLPMNEQLRTLNPAASMHHSCKQYPIGKWTEYHIRQQLTCCSCACAPQVSDYGCSFSHGVVRGCSSYVCYSLACRCTLQTPQDMSCTSSTARRVLMKTASYVAIHDAYVCGASAEQ